MQGRGSELGRARTGPTATMFACRTSAPASDCSADSPKNSPILIRPRSADLSLLSPGLRLCTTTSPDLMRKSASAASPMLTM